MAFSEQISLLNIVMINLHIIQEQMRGLHGNGSGLQQVGESVEESITFHMNLHPLGSEAIILKWRQVLKVSSQV